MLCSGSGRRPPTCLVPGDDYLDSDFACDAIAAATVVASQLPGGEPLTTAYAPDFLVDGGTLDIPADVPGLALRALDRIAADDSEWRSLWEYTHEQAITELQPLRTPIERAANETSKS
ncbi:DUF4259 domain-containing protein [Actinoplanes sp. TBRC 11911]|uniref:DUF4259 domain-containing protein n=1 Tax=Actinoplanes sp. TBRC 11911 TaxID=2729386 RepID=UPI00145F2FDA|nr:DUF4259 domain-containing protein [Actinoplanes sp. TBRC 11911]NMO51830.1 DUF4259 domain-containing protein [Actinoplanes sp. TBRC 11911]